MAVVGAWSSHISAKLATLAAVTPGMDADDDYPANEGFVNISPASAAYYLEDRDRYPYICRTHATPGDFGSEVVTSYLNSLGVRQVAVLYPETGFGRSILQGMCRQAKPYNMRVFSVGFVDGDIDSMRQAIELL